MRTIFEMFGRAIIGLTNVILLVLGEPYVKDMIPVLEPYSTYIIYTCIVILGVWIVNPFADFLYGYTHRHQR